MSAQQYPDDLYYTKDHEWARLEDRDGQKFATIGVTRFAVDQLGDVTQVDLPKEGETLKQVDEHDVGVAKRSWSGSHAAWWPRRARPFLSTIQRFEQRAAFLRERLPACAAANNERRIIDGTLRHRRCSRQREGRAGV